MLNHALIDADVWKSKRTKTLQSWFQLHLLAQSSAWKRARYALPAFVAERNPQPRQLCCCTTAGERWCRPHKRRVWGHFPDFNSSCTYSPTPPCTNYNTKNVSLYHLFILFMQQICSKHLNVMHLSLSFMQRPDLTLKLWL